MLNGVLQKSWTVIRESDGTYTDGIWEAELEELTVTGVLQRLTPRQIEALPEGLKEARVQFQFFLHGGSDGLRPLREGRTDGDRTTGRRPDRIVGPLDPVDSGLTRNVYEVIEMMIEDTVPWRPVPITHARYYLRQVTPPIGGLEGTE